MIIEVESMEKDWEARYLKHLDRVTEEIGRMKKDFREKPDKLGQTDNNETGEYLKSTSKWVKVEGLYRLAVLVGQYMGHENVVLDIFRYNIGNVPFNPEEYVPDCIPKDRVKEKPSKMLNHLKESFTFEEIEQIEEYFNKFNSVTVGKPELCSLPRDGRIWPTGAHRYDEFREQGFIVFCNSENYPLPFDIAGYYDLLYNLPFTPDEITDHFENRLYWAVKGINPRKAICHKHNRKLHKNDHGEFICEECAYDIVEEARVGVSIYDEDLWFDPDDKPTMKIDGIHYGV